MKKLNNKKRPNGAGAMAQASSHFDPCRCLSLYSGQILLGHLLHSARGVEAFVDGKSIGVFSSQKSASDAISAKNGAAS
jgi:hypothetical protein